MNNSLLEEDWVVATRRGTGSVKREDFEDLVEYVSLHANELFCLTEAEEGNPKPLADHIREFGFLATEDAREYVRARILGLPQKEGRRRTLAKQAEDLVTYCAIRKIQECKRCTEYQARRFYLEEHPDANPENAEVADKARKRYTCRLLRQTANSTG